MNTRPSRTIRRFDRTIRAVMWMDAFLSVALVVVCIVATPILATLGVPAGMRMLLGLSAITIGVLLAAFGAITAVLLMLRMRDGDYLLPSRLRLPLPPGMRPDLSATEFAIEAIGLDHGDRVQR